MVSEPQLCNYLTVHLWFSVFQAYRPSQDFILYVVFFESRRALSKRCTRLSVKPPVWTMQGANGCCITLKTHAMIFRLTSFLLSFWMSHFQILDGNGGPLRWTPTSRLTRSSGFVAMTRRKSSRSFPMMLSPWSQKMISELANEIEPTKNIYLFSTFAQKHPHCWERHVEPYYYVESIWRPISSWWMRFLKISADCAKCRRRKCSLTECWSPTSIFKKFFTSSSIVDEGDSCMYWPVFLQ